MKKIWLSLLLLSATPAFAQMPYMEEAKALGILAGQGLACEASKYKTFELLARAIILTKSPSDSQQNAALKAFLEKKADIFVAKQLDNFADCANIAQRFDNQAIFQATLYADGTIKMPDGQILTPRKPYDASAIYDFKAQDLQHANAIYNSPKGSGNKINFIDKTVEVGNQQENFEQKAEPQKIIASPTRIVRQK